MYSVTVMSTLYVSTGQGAVAGQYPLHRLARQGCFQQGGQSRPRAADGTAGSNQPLLHLLAAVHPICCGHSCGPQCHRSCMALLLCQDLQTHLHTYATVHHSITSYKNVEIDV